MSPAELEWERLAIRMLHKVCPAKDTHAAIEGEHCPRCGISPSDHARFVVGSEGKRRA